MRIKMLKPCLLNGHGGLPLSVGQHAYPKTLDEGRDLIAKGYAVAIDDEPTVAAVEDAPKPAPAPGPRRPGPPVVNKAR